MLSEKRGFSINGYLAFFVILPVLQLGFAAMVFEQILQVFALIGSVLTAICWAGFFMVQPNQA